MVATVATNAPWTRQSEDREPKIHEQHATDASQYSFHHRSQPRGPWGRPSSNRVLLYIQKSSAVPSDDRCCLNSTTRTSSSADLVLEDTGTLAAADNGRLAVWAHSPLFSGLGAASTAAGRCISAGAPPRPLTRALF